MGSGCSSADAPKSANNSTHAFRPAIAVTAYASASDRQRAIAAGYDMHIAKPIDPYELTRAILNLAPPRVRVRSGRNSNWTQQTIGGSTADMRQ
jgi:CheY-like chemotaxis protein